MSNRGAHVGRRVGDNLRVLLACRSEANDDFLPRAEVRWENDGRKHEVHIYEAYWAPLTEGKVTYWDTIKFLLRAGYRGLKHSLPWRRSFDRWMFGEPKVMKIGPFTFIGLL